MSEDAKVMDQTWFFIYSEFTRTGQPVRGQDVITFVVERVRPHVVQKIIDVMVHAKLIERHLDDQHGITYTPRPRKKSA